MARTGRPENLRVPTSEQAREIGRKGGYASVESKKKHKLMSEIYADFLVNKHRVNVDGEDKEMSGEELVLYATASALLEKGGRAALLKELREGTEGSKVQIDGGITVVSNIDVEGV